MNRSEIREEAFKLMYSIEIQKNINNLEEQIELYLYNKQKCNRIYKRCSFWN